MTHIYDDSFVVEFYKTVINKELERILSDKLSPSVISRKLYSSLLEIKNVVTDVNADKIILLYIIIEIYKVVKNARFLIHFCRDQQFNHIDENTRNLILTLLDYLLFRTSLDIVKQNILNIAKSSPTLYELAKDLIDMLDYIDNNITEQEYDLDKKDSVSSNYSYYNNIVYEYGSKSSYQRNVNDSSNLISNDTQQISLKKLLRDIFIYILIFGLMFIFIYFFII